MNFTLTRELLHQILDYDPTTHRLTPKPSLPKDMPIVRSNGKHQIIIDAHNYSMKKIAYLYHTGKTSSRITQKDGNKDNYAPDNLIGYKPVGRKLQVPYIDALPDKDILRGDIFRAVLRAPEKPPYTPQVKFLPIYDEYGYAIVCESAGHAIRMGNKYHRQPSRSDLIKLGMLPPTAP